MSAADNRKKYLKIGELISRFELNNIAEGKSPKTVLWYSEMLSAFIKYLKANDLCQDGAIEHHLVDVAVTPAVAIRTIPASIGLWSTGLRFRSARTF